jgi:predicted ester cyclase
MSLRAHCSTPSTPATPHASTRSSRDRFWSYDVHGTRSLTGLKRYLGDLRRSFSGLRFEVHENIGVLAEGDLVAQRTIITGTHTGGYASVAPTGSPVQTSAGGQPGQRSTTAAP